MQYKTLAEFKIFCDRERAVGHEPPTLMIDNDDTAAHDDDLLNDGEDSVRVFEMHPVQLLEEALDLLGIPHDQV
jgi:hypothetical protein